MLVQGQAAKPYGRLDSGFCALPRATNGVVRWRYAFLAANVALFVAAVVLVQGFGATSCARRKARFSTCRRRCPACDQRAGWVLQQIDKKLAAFRRSRAVRQARGRGHGDGLRADLDDQGHGAAQDQKTWRPGCRKTSSFAEMDQPCRSSLRELVGAADRGRTICRTPASRRRPASK